MFRCLIFIFYFISIVNSNENINVLTSESCDNNLDESIIENEHNFEIEKETNENAHSESSCCPSRNNIEKHTNNFDDLIENNNNNNNDELNENDKSISNLSLDNSNHNRSFHQVLIRAGKFLMGSESKILPKHVAKSAANLEADGEFPARKVRLSSYYIDKYPVTNAQFNAFIEETKHITDAEKYGWSFVFEMFLNKKQLKQATQAVAGALWWSKKYLNYYYYFSDILCININLKSSY